MMQTVVPSIMPLKFKALGASNVLIGLFASSIPSFLAVFMNPYISFKSDRYRSRWGRRIPFIFRTLPPLCVSLVGLAFGEEIAKILMPHIQALSASSPATLAVVILGALLVVFLFFDQFVNAVFCGLFNDVVPTPLMGRFMGTMRIVGSSVGFFYNYFIFQYAESHMREIFLGAAVLYFLGVGLMCLFVRESAYPPPSSAEQKASRGLSGVKSYFQESFCHKFYWTKFSYTACGGMSYAGIGAFMIFFYKEMGLPLGDIGKVSAITSLVVVGTAYFGSICFEEQEQSPFVGPQTKWLRIDLWIWVGMTIVGVADGLQGGVILLRWGNLLTNTLFLVAIFFLRRMERGHAPMLDYDGHASALSGMEEIPLPPACSI